jgi:small GTP-binding protein
MSKSWDFMRKIIVIGSSTTGKTSLLNRYSDDTFSTDFITTIGLDFKIKTIELNGHKIKLQMWDTAGQERFKTLTSAYYRNANGCLFVCDVTNRETFNDLNMWIKEFHDKKNENCICVIVGNKIDEIDRKVSPNELEKLAKFYNFKYFETSAKGNIGVDKMFSELTLDMIESLNRNPTPGITLASTISRNLSLENDEKVDSKSTNKNKCCNY